MCRGRGPTVSTKDNSQFSTCDSAARTYRYTDYTERGVIEHRTKSLAVPVLFKYTFTDGRFRPYALGGPSVSFTTDGRMVSRRSVETDAGPEVIRSRYGSQPDREDNTETSTRYVGVEAGLVLGFGLGARTYSVRASGYQMKVGVTFALRP